MHEAILHTVQNTSHTDPDWQAKANCAFVEQRVMIPRLSTMKAAKEICKNCPVSQQCLEYALSLTMTAWEEEAVWGGMDKWERKSLKQERLRAATIGRTTLKAA